VWHEERMTKIADNIAALKKQMGSKTTLVAVSKQQPEDRIDAALAAGQRVFGENRVQEAEERWISRRPSYADLSLHLIGPLQTNKVRDAVALFDVIETLDRVKLADAIAAEITAQGRKISCYVQVNTGDEEQKAGVSLGELPMLLEHCRAIGLAVDGLMCIPPVDEPSGLHFALLKKLSQDHGLKNLSMGMSDDFEKALRLGATHVRIGTGVFGNREKA
jgi:pyridoxal phosphate enzyme (YggS family)